MSTQLWGTTAAVREKFATSFVGAVLFDVEGNAPERGKFDTASSIGWSEWSKIEKISSPEWLDTSIFREYGAHGLGISAACSGCDETSNMQYRFRDRVRSFVAENSLRKKNQRKSTFFSFYVHFDSKNLIITISYQKVWTISWNERTSQFFASFFQNVCDIKRNYPRKYFLPHGAIEKKKKIKLHPGTFAPFSKFLCPFFVNSTRERCKKNVSLRGDFFMGFFFGFVKTSTIRNVFCSNFVFFVIMIPSVLEIKNFSGLLIFCFLSLFYRMETVKFLKTITCFRLR